MNKNKLNKKDFEIIDDVLSGNLQKSKELSPLEALDELHCVAYGMKKYDSNTIKAEKIIESALKRLEKYENTVFIAMGSPEFRNKEWLKDLFEKPPLIIPDAAPLEFKPIYSEQDQKKIKAFEILRDKICVGFFIGLDKKYVYVLELKNSKHFIQITKEQYDILMEVLL